MPHDVFEDDDGVVHHHPDGDGEAHNGNDIDCVVEYVEKDEGDDQGEGDGQGDDQAGADLPEKEEGDDDDEEAAKIDRFGKITDGVSDVPRGVDNDLDSDIFGNPFLDVSEFFHDGIHDFHRVGFRLLLDHQDYTGTPIFPRLFNLLLEAVLDGGDIPEIEYVILVLPDDELVQFLRVLEPSNDSQVEIKTACFEVSRGKVNIFRFQDGLEFLHGDVVGLQFIFVEEDVDLPFQTRPEDDRSHAGHPLQRVGDHLIGDLIELRVAFRGRDGRNDNG